MNAREMRAYAQRGLESLRANYLDPSKGPHYCMGQAWALLETLAGAGAQQAPWDKPPAVNSTEDAAVEK